MSNTAVYEVQLDPELLGPHAPDGRHLAVPLDHPGETIWAGDVPGRTDERLSELGLPADLKLSLSSDPPV